MRRSSRSSPARAAAGLCALLALAAACASAPQDRLQTSKAEQRIDVAVTKSTGQPVDQVRCPTTVDLRRGATFRCTAQVAGQPVEVRATQRTDRGDLRVEVQAAVIQPALVGTDLKNRLDGQFGRPFTVDCGDPSVRVLKPGATFSCQASDATSQRQVKVTVKDLAGTLAYDVGTDPGPAPDNNSLSPVPTTAPVTPTSSPP